MATSNALDTLIELATKDSDGAAKELGRRNRLADEAQQKLELLQQFRDDYAKRFEQSMANGLTASSYRNFQLFIDKIDSALAGQQDVVRMARGRIEEAKTAWQGCERKRLSYGTLATRAKNAAAVVASKRDQKQSDEFAARMAHYNSRH
jgi:flagellar FliJ protein